MTRLVLGVLLLLSVGCSDGDGGGGAPTPPETTTDAATRQLAEAVLATADTSGDRRLSAEEYAQVAFPDEPLALYDQDQDAYLSLGELITILETADPARLQAQRRQQAGPPPGAPGKVGKGKGKGKGGGSPGPGGAP